MIGVTEALLLGIGQGFVSTFSQAHPFLHTYVVLPVSFVTFSLSLFILAKTFLITPTFVSLMPSFNRQKLLPSILVAKVTNVDDKIEQHLASPRPTIAIRQRTIPVTKGCFRPLDFSIHVFDFTGRVKLDALEIRAGDVAPWIVFCNANGVPYEHNVDFLEMYSTALPANILTFNYRGVGRSTGWPLSSKDLVDDASAVVQLLVDSGVNPAHIILHGHSLGGGVAVHTARRHAEVKLIHDRSFRSMERAAQVILSQLNGFMSFFVAFVLFVAAALAVRFSIFSDRVPLWMMFWTAVGCGYAIKLSQVLFPLAPAILRIAGWGLDSVEHFDVDRALCIFHPADEVIPQGRSDSYTVLYEKHSNQLRSFQLRSSHPELPHHMYPLHTNQEEWTELITVIQKFIQS
eukprot:gene10055-2227_t